MNLYLTLVLTVAAPLLHFYGVHNHLYESQGGFWWFDHVTHFVSGLSVTAILLLALSPLYTLLAFGICMILWEVGEYLIGTPKTMWISFRNMVYDFAFSWLACFSLLLVTVL